MNLPINLYLAHVLDQTNNSETMNFGFSRIVKTYEYKVILYTFKVDYESGSTLSKY